MKCVKQTAIIFGLFLFGCNETQRKNPIINANEKLVNKSNEKSINNDTLNDSKILDANKAACVYKVIALFKQKDINKIKKNLEFLDRINKKIEVVINEWGILSLINENFRENIGNDTIVFTESIILN